MQKIDDTVAQPDGVQRTSEDSYNKELDIAGKLAMQFSEHDTVLQREKSTDQVSDRA